MKGGIQVPGTSGFRLCFFEDDACSRGRKSIFKMLGTRLTCLSAFLLVKEFLEDYLLF